MATGEKVRVAVRVRPLSRREIDLGTKSIVEMQENQTIIHHPSEHSRGKQPKSFAYDHCFWSADESDAHYADQSRVFGCLGYELLDNAFNGYNACMFVYGQTGSGKSYTMMGTPEQLGIIPRFCHKLFDSINEVTNNDSRQLFKVEVSYMEIYNEKVRDLLDPKGTKHNLRVREHSILGPYVDGLSVLAVSSLEQMQELMEEGNKSRTVAATNMNAESSRSHAVFSIRISQTLYDEATGVIGERASKVSLVDLAGSERAEKSGAIGERLREGGSINKSLTTLGLVISALADQSSAMMASFSSSTTSLATAGGKQQKKKFVPYRDSVLTWLLKDSLGGNSKTVMIATISPAGDNYEESLSTLRYADRAKRIVNHAVINEDPNAKIIRDLRTEVEQLRSQLMERSAEPDLRDRLVESEKLIAEMSVSWEERLKETERLHQERQSFLEKMGISVQTSGIRVEKEKFYLVNLNADPAMNELLVYYLKDKSLIGSPKAPTEVDIMLEGIAILPLHACLTIENQPPQLFVEPTEGARTFVNGSSVGSKTALRHGDRLLIGNNHFFRVNCPSTASQGVVSQNQFDYDFAQEEVTNKEMSNDPVAATVAVLEKQHQLDKEAALEKQRRMYEQQIQALKSQCASPMTPQYDFPLGFGARWGASTPSTPSSFPLSNVQSGYVQWARERDTMFKKSLSRLKEDIVKANSMAREANLIAADMAKQTVYGVTLQIPANNLTPKRIRTGAFISEPAILVRRKNKGSQLWGMEKLENKLIDMRELYSEWKRETNGTERLEYEASDPFFESQEAHALIGVANVFLEVLFHDVKLDYHVPLISQQGEVAGRLHVEVYRVRTTHSEAEDKMKDDTSDTCSTTSSSSSMSLVGSFLGKTITCRVRIKSATGLPRSLSHFVFCQYNFWSHASAVVPPSFDPNEGEPNSVHKPESLVFHFDHEKDFEITVTEEFLEFIQEDALSIQVWGHRSSGFSPALANQICRPDRLQQELSFEPSTIGDMSSRSLRERWAEVTRRLKVWVEIHELNDQGKYMSVTTTRDLEAGTGGVYQLRQGQQRRIMVDVSFDDELTDSRGHESLPIVCQRVTSVSIGCVCVRHRSMQKALDSYQDLDLETLRQRWMEALDQRRSYLDNQIQRLINKPDKSDLDVEREQSLITQWVTLTEERNAVHVPAPDSNLPGAPAHERPPPPGMEKHIPVVFMDWNDDTTVTNNMPLIAGAQSVLPKEQSGKMCILPLIRAEPGETRVIASWDSSIHEHTSLNKTTAAHERVYAILKIVVRLSHPAEIDLHLRKRLCLTIVRPPGFAERLFKRIVGTELCTGTGVCYDVVSHIPKSSFDPEARETLALVAARADSSEAANGESYIERYTRGISEVESILALDRLRQELVIRELLNATVKSNLKRHASMPLSERISTKSLPTSRSDNANLSEQARPNGSSQLMVSLSSPVVVGGIPQSAACLPSVQEEQVLPAELHHQNIKPVPLPILETSLSCPNSEETESAHSSGYGSQLCLGQRGGCYAPSFDEHDEVCLERQNKLESTPTGEIPSTILSNSTSFSEYNAQMMDTSIVSTESSLDMVNNEEKSL